MGWTYMKLYCDNKYAISIAHNLVQLDRIKHIEMDKYFIKKKLDNNLICIQYVFFSKTTCKYIITKRSNNNNFKKIIFMLEMENTYSRESGRV